MRIIKKLFRYFILLIILLVTIIWGLTKYLAPTYKGEQSLTKLTSKAVIYYDSNGVPHIEANNQEDAYRAFGYAHAQDRLFQMEIMRRIAAGRLSEIFGKNTVRVDKFMGSLGIEEQAYKTIANLDKNSKSYQLTEAYLSGINDFINNEKTPIEFYLLGIKKENYTLKDIYNVFGYLSFSFATAHKTDPLINEIQEKLGDAYVKELDIPTSHTTITSSTNKQKITAEISKTINEVLDSIPAPQLDGSNAWVLNSERTQNGKVIFANDPHMKYAQPSVWYQAHIKTPDYQMYGYHLALIPFPLLGHNKEYAYGLTMFLNDDVDFYIEENNPENNLEYKHKDEYLRYKTFEKTIKIKGQQDTTFTLKVSKHGPIVNGIIDQIQDSRPIAMQWMYTKLPNQFLELTYGISHADSLAQFKKATALLHAPGLNFMYGDTKNNIAWIAGGKLYNYRDSLNRKTFLNGASGEDEIKEFIDFKDNPKAINPKWNYVYSANNQPDSINGKLYPGYYANEDRAKRITNLIEPKFNFTKQDTEKMITDVKSDVVSQVIKSITDVIDINNLNSDEKRALDYLLNWNGAYIKQDVAPTIYTRFVYEFLKATFKDELGKQGFNQFMNGIYLQKKMLAVQISKNESLWWDNTNTENIKETKKEIVTSAFKNAIAFLNSQLGPEMDSWSWSKVSEEEHEHPLGKGGKLLRYLFNVGPYKTDGGLGVINKKSYKIDSTGYYKINGGASTRRVIDFSDIENSSAIVPTGQSGNRFSPFYKNQNEKYRNNEFVKMIMNPKEYRRTERRLVFLPNQ